MTDHAAPQAGILTPQAGILAAQAGILEELPAHARYIRWRRVPGTDPRPALTRLAERTAGGSLVVGVGESLVRELGAEVPGLRTFPALVAAGASNPSIPGALWTWLRASRRGDLVREMATLNRALAPAFAAESETEAFDHGSRDLTGYEDGTENPDPEDAPGIALVSGAGPGLDGGSFVAVQRWAHDLRRFAEFGERGRDLVIGRRLRDNEEIGDAPPTAHVKRTEQEAFDPPAFVWRRSMPWSDRDGLGLVFVAFGASLDPFEKQLRRMVGEEDGVVDALFHFSRPLDGAYYWCPPVAAGRLDLRALLG